jgi:hypothetical protein
MRVLLQKFSIVFIILWIPSTVVVPAQTLEVGAEGMGYTRTYVNVDGYAYSFIEPIQYDEDSNLEFLHSLQKMVSTSGVCGAVGGMTVNTVPIGTDSLSFRFSADATRIDSVHFVFHNLCGFTRLEISSTSTPGQLIDPSTCIATWTLTCITNIVAGHRLRFNLNSQTVTDSVRSISSCGTTCAVRQFSYSTTGVELLSTEIPDEIILHQNYPNPFNPSTTIRFSLPRMSDVTMTIFDLLGQEVTILVDERLAPGLYVFDWNPIGMPSGMYFCHLHAGQYTETKKLILVR